MASKSHDLNFRGELTASQSTTLTTLVDGILGLEDYDSFFVFSGGAGALDITPVISGETGETYSLTSTGCWLDITGVGDFNLVETAGDTTKIVIVGYRGA